MKTTRTYKINLRFTCPYIGSRNGGNRTMVEGLTIKNANAQLLSLFNQYSDHYYYNWGNAILATKHATDGAYTDKEGLRWFRYDSRIFEILPQY